MILATFTIYWRPKLKVDWQMGEMLTKVLEQAEEEDFGMSTLGQVRKDILMELIWYFKDISRYFDSIYFF